MKNKSSSRMESFPQSLKTSIREKISSSAKEKDCSNVEFTTNSDEFVINSCNSYNSSSISPGRQSRRRSIEPCILCWVTRPKFRTTMSFSSSDGCGFIDIPLSFYLQYRRLPNYKIIVSHYVKCVNQCEYFFHFCKEYVQKHIL